MQDSFIKLIQSSSSSTTKKTPQSLQGGKKKSVNAKKSKVAKKKSKATLTEVVGAPVYLNQNIHYWSAGLLGIANVCFAFLLQFLY